MSNKQFDASFILDFEASEWDVSFRFIIAFYKLLCRRKMAYFIFLITFKLFGLCCRETKMTLWVEEDHARKSNFFQWSTEMEAWSAIEKVAKLLHSEDCLTFVNKFSVTTLLKLLYRFQSLKRNTRWVNTISALKWL